MQVMGLYPANSIFIGDYLTTQGQTARDDLRMIEGRGLRAGDARRCAILRRSLRRPAGIVSARSAPAHRSLMSSSMSIANIRRDYRQATLDEADVDADPTVQFQRWFAEALRAEVNEPNAMFLATATPDAYPSGRVVLLKGVDERGFVFLHRLPEPQGSGAVGQSARIALLLLAGARATGAHCWRRTARQSRGIG
jgi:hypothetical protein